MKRGVALHCLACLALIALGCRKADDPTYDLGGTVQLDGSPLLDGQISFMDPNGTTPVVLPISSGGFAGKARAGNYRVEIRAYRTSERAPRRGPGDKEGPPKENYIPERYNSLSELQAEVKPKDPNQFRFDLQSSP